MKKKKAFSIIELTISFIIVALITGISAPILSKKLKNTKIKNINLISRTCSEINTNCILCYGKKGEKICLSCNLSCSADSYLDKQNCTCVPCWEKYPKSAPVCNRCDGQFCRKCVKNKGYYLDRNPSLNPRNQCKDCEINYFCPDGIDRINCPSHSTTKNLTLRWQANQCICNGGYWRTVAATNVNKGICRDCGKGYYCPDSSQPDSDVGEGDNKRRKPCRAPYYCPSENALSQTTCPPNSATNVDYATNITQCICGAGYYGPNGGPCVKCPKGHYCPGGNIKNPCAAGKYNDLEGQSSITACKTCPQGYISSQGAAFCSYCTAGSYENGYRTVCNACEAGYWCEGGVHRAPCPSNTYSLGKTSCATQGCACGSCRNGNNGNSCTSCIGPNKQCTSCNNSFVQCKAAASNASVCLHGGVCYRHPKSSECAGNTEYTAVNGGVCVNSKARSYDGVTVVHNTLNQIGGSMPEICARGKECCWQSNNRSNGFSAMTSNPNKCTVNTEDTTIGYTACSRTVCNYAAAYKLCNMVTTNGFWTFPEKEELGAFVGNKYNLLQLCVAKNAPSKTSEVRDFWGYCPIRNNACCHTFKKVVAGGATNWNADDCIGCAPGYILYGRSGNNYLKLTDFGAYTTGAYNTNNGQAVHVRCAIRWVRDN